MSDWQKRAEAAEAALRQVIVNVGGVAREGVSLNFLRLAPEEVRLMRDRLIVERDAAVRALGKSTEKGAPGRFVSWETATLADQCRAQAKENLDPEYSQFMEAVAGRLVDRAAAVRAGMERAAGVADDQSRLLSWDQKSRCTADVIATAIRAASIGAGDDGWRPISEILTSEPVLAGLWVTYNPTGERWWESHVITVDDETGDVHDDEGWSLQDFEAWRPLPPAPASTDAEGALTPPVRSQEGS